MARCFHGRGTEGQCDGQALTGSAFCLMHGATAEQTMTQPGADPALVSAKIAQALLSAEAIERAQAARKRSGRAVRREGDEEFEGMVLPDGTPRKRQPFTVVPRRSRPDPTQIIDPITGKPPASLVPGYCTRWVRVRDHENRPTMARVGEFEDYGYVPVTDANGDPIEGRFGVAMMAPPEQSAERTRDKTPATAHERDAALEHAFSITEEINALAGEGVASIVTEADHGRRRTLHGPGVTDLNE